MSAKPCDSTDSRRALPVGQYMTKEVEKKGSGADPA